MAGQRRGRRGASESGELNPYIALSDLVITVILIVVFVVALGQLQLAGLRYQRAMKEFSDEVNRLPEAIRPYWEKGRNDPPGVQRWVFSGEKIFAPSAPRRNLTDPLAPPVLTPRGAEALARFAQLLKANQGHWRRIRVEGHTQPPSVDQMDDWELSAARAAVVARQVQLAGRIPSFYLAVAGRAGQNHLYRVMVFYRSSDPTSQMAFQALEHAGIAMYSKKDIDKDPEAREDWEKRNLRGVPVVRLQDSNDREETVPVINDQALRELARKWGKNDRVEILVEYSQNQSG